MTLKKVFELDVTTSKKIRELWVPEEIWNKLVKERDHHNLLDDSWHNIDDYGFTRGTESHNITM